MRTFYRFLIVLLFAVPLRAQVNVQTLNASGTVSLQTKNNLNTLFNITLTGNVTIASIDTGFKGQQANFNICQNSVGGFTWAWPSTFYGTSGISIATGASVCTQAQFVNVDGTTWQSTGGGSSITSVSSLPGTCAAGQAFQLPDGTIVSCPSANTFISNQPGPGFIYNGLTADCPLLETSGTTINCGGAGNGTFAAGNAAPQFPNVANLGTMLAFDNFLDAGLLTQGKWTQQQGTWTTASGVATWATGGGDAGAYAVYSAIPATTYSQWVQATISVLPSGGNGVGVILGWQAGSENGYICDENNLGQMFILKNTAGVFTTIAGPFSHTNASGDVLLFKMVHPVSSLTATLTCNVNGVQVLSGSDGAAFLTPGYAGIFANAANAAVKNFSTGNFNNSPVASGLLFAGDQSVTLPASLNLAVTIEAYVCYQRQSNLNTYNGIVVGNGSGAASNANGIIITGSNNTGDGPSLQNRPHAGMLSGSLISTTESYSSLNGCGTITEVFGASSPGDLDRVYVNGIEGPYVQGQHGASAGLQTVGAYLLGGSASGSGFSSNTFFTGTIYRIRFFNRELAPNEITQEVAAFNAYMAGRGITTFMGDTYGTDICLANGDSLISGFGNILANTWFSFVTLFNPANGNPYSSGQCFDQGITAAGQFQLTPANPNNAAPFISLTGNRNVYINWAGTNDVNLYGQSIGSTIGQVVTDAKAMRKAGFNFVIEVNMPSRGTGGACGSDTNVENFNPVFRQYLVPPLVDGWVNVHDDPSFAHGGCTSNYYQADNIHMSGYGQNRFGWMQQREINRVTGNNSWAAANTYTVSGTAATTITASTEAGNIVTLTMAANPWVAGQCVVVTGVTPAGYNTPANQCALVQTITATTLTYFSPNSGLGAGTVFGTVQGPLQLDQDLNKMILGGSAAGPTAIIQSCIGQTDHESQVMVTNTNASPWVVSPQFSGETINGGASLTMPVATATNRPVVRFRAILTSNSTGGCTWLASIQ